MARARNIKPGLFKNEVLGTQDPIISLLFIGLWTLADKAGRLEDRPARIKAELFPYREGLDINGYLTVIEQLGFIHRYKVGNLSLIQIINFSKHQHPHHTEKDSELPEYKEENKITVKDQLSNGYAPSDSLIPDSLNTDSLIQKPPASSGTDLLWTIGLEYLGGEKSRSLLGMLVKKHGRDSVEEAVEICMANEVDDPKKYIVKVLNGKSRSAPPEEDEIEKAYAHFKWEQEMTNAA